MTGQPIFPQRTDPDLNADAIIAGREPSASLTIAATGSAHAKYAQAVVDFLDAWKYCPVATSPNPSRACLESAAEQLLDALSIPGTSSGYEEDYLAAERGRQEELARKVGFLETVLDGITQKAEQALHSPASGKVSALYDIRESVNAALQRPVAGTRVKRLIPPRGDQGSVVGWSAELNVPLIEWDSERGLTPEACEPHEFTTDLNEEIPQ